MTALEAMLDRVVTPDRPGDPAIVAANGRRVATRGQLADRVRAYAGAWEHAGFAPGDAVAFAVRQDGDGIAWLLAALRAGIVVIVLDPGLAPASLAARCRVAGVVAVVMDGGVATVAGSAVLRALAARRGIRLPDPASSRPRCGRRRGRSVVSRASTGSRAGTRAGRSTGTRRPS